MLTVVGLMPLQQLLLLNREGRFYKERKKRGRVRVGEMKEGRRNGVKSGRVRWQSFHSWVGITEEGGKRESPHATNVFNLQHHTYSRMTSSTDRCQYNCMVVIK